MRLSHWMFSCEVAVVALLMLLVAEDDVIVANDVMVVSFVLFRGCVYSEVALEVFHCHHHRFHCSLLCFAFLLCL